MEKYERVKITPSEALAIYKEKYSDTIVKEVELELKSRRFVLEIKMTLANGQYANHKYDLDTGDLIRKK